LNRITGGDQGGDQNESSGGTAIEYKVENRVGIRCKVDIMWEISWKYGGIAQPQVVAVTARQCLIATLSSVRITYKHTTHLRIHVQRISHTHAISPLITSETKHLALYSQSADPPDLGSRPTGSRGFYSSASPLLVVDVAPPFKTRTKRYTV
jgi:hypothetical protein